MILGNVLKIYGVFNIVMNFEQMKSEYIFGLLNDAIT